jgi:hypothetical protein
VDADLMHLVALEPTSDPRGFEVRVAGPAALLVAKLHKIGDRHGTGRQSDKDALEVEGELTERIEPMIQELESRARERRDPGRLEPPSAALEALDSTPFVSPGSCCSRLPRLPAHLICGRAAKTRPSW